MDLIDTLNISASGLSAQRVRLQTISANLANARTTRTEDGGPYRRRTPVFESTKVDPFGSQLDKALAGVRVGEIEIQDGGGRVVYDPGHPDANAEGYVNYPDINIMHEMVDLMTASRSYEANANVLDATKQIAERALQIGR